MAVWRTAIASMAPDCSLLLFRGNDAEALQSEYLRGCGGRVQMFVSAVETAVVMNTAHGGDSVAAAY